MNKQDKNGNMYTVLERVIITSDADYPIAAGTLGKIINILTATNNDLAGEKWVTWVSPKIDDSVIFERRLCL